MAKNIKFNLIIDEKPIRTLEALEENFVIDDILNYFKNGLLEKWLEVRCYNDLCEKIKLIDKNANDVDIILSIVDIFGFDIDSSNVESSIYNIEYQNKIKSDLIRYKRNNFNIKEIINDYHNDYFRLKDTLLSNVFSIEKFLRFNFDNFQCLIKIHENNTFILSYYYFSSIGDLIHILKKGKVDFKDNKYHFTNEDLSIFSLVNKSVYSSPHESTNIHLLKLSIVDSKNVSVEICLENSKEIIINCTPNVICLDSIKMKLKLISKDYKNLLKLDLLSFSHLFWQKEPLVIYLALTIDNLRKIILDNDEIVKKISNFNSLEYHLCLNYFKKCNDITEDYYKDIEDSGKKYMIIHIDSGTFVRSYGNSKEELSPDDVNGKFPILDGIQYKNKSKNNTLVYLEV